MPRLSVCVDLANDRAYEPFERQCLAPDVLARRQAEREAPFERHDGDVAHALAARSPRALARRLFSRGAASALGDGGGECGASARAFDLDCYASVLHAARALDRTLREVPRASVTLGGVAVVAASCALLDGSRVVVGARTRAAALARAHVQMAARGVRGAIALYESGASPQRLVALSLGARRAMRRALEAQLARAHAAWLDGSLHGDDDDDDDDDAELGELAFNFEDAAVHSAELERAYALSDARVPKRALPRVTFDGSVAAAATACDAARAAALRRLDTRARRAPSPRRRARPDIRSDDDDDDNDNNDDEAADARDTTRNDAARGAITVRFDIAALEWLRARLFK